MLYFPAVRWMTATLLKPRVKRRTEPLPTRFLCTHVTALSIEPTPSLACGNYDRRWYTD
jgi:hypothetical protein